MRHLSRLAVNGCELSHLTKQETVNANCDNVATVFKQFNQRLEYPMRHRQPFVPVLQVVSFLVSV